MRKLVVEKNAPRPCRTSKKMSFVRGIFPKGCYIIKGLASTQQCSISDLLSNDDGAHLFLSKTCRKDRRRPLQRWKNRRRLSKRFWAGAKSTHTKAQRRLFFPGPVFRLLRRLNKIFARRSAYPERLKAFSQQLSNELLHLSFVSIIPGGFLDEKKSLGSELVTSPNKTFWLFAKPDAMLIVRGAAK